MNAQTAAPIRSERQKDRLGAFQVLVFGLCFATALIDGFDTQAVAYAGPFLMQLVHGDKAALGLIFSAGLLGGLAGGLFFGSLGDRIGRKPLLVVSLIVIAAGSLATALAHTGTEIATWRFATGLGLGGAIPGIIALSAEFATPRRRSTIVAIVFSGFPFGAIAGSLIATAVLPLWGWRMLFVVGAALPAILVIPAALHLPESLQFLARSGKKARLEKLLSRIGNSATALLQDAAHDGKEHRRGSVFQLFADGLAPVTLLIWVICFVSLLSVYCLVNWLPTLAAAAGLPLQTAVLAIAALNIGGIVGNIVLGRLIDRTGSFRSTGAAYIIGAAFVGTIGLSVDSSSQMLGICFAAGVFAIGAQLSVTAIIARLYSTAMRSTGVGWSFGIGRLGGVAGPAIAGLLLGSGMGFTNLMLVIGALSFATGIAVLVLHRFHQTNSRSHLSETVAAQGESRI